MTGAALNRLVAAINARTPLNAAAANPAGFQGVTSQGAAAPPGMPDRFRADRVYFVGAKLLARAAGHLAARSPRRVTADTPPGPARPSVAPPTDAGVAALQRDIRRATPRATSAHSPAGYRLPSGDKTARLTIELSTRLGYARICSLGESLATPGTFIISTTDTNVFENGSFDYVVEASGDIEGYEEGEEPDECAAPVITDGEDAEFDYGGFVSSSFTEVALPFGDVADVAIATAETASPVVTTALLEWPESTWSEVSAAAPAALADLGGCAVALASPGVFLASIATVRLLNRGGSAIKADWLLKNSDTDAEVDSGTVVITRGAAVTIDLPDTTLDTPLQLTLRRVRLGRYLHLA